MKCKGMLTIDSPPPGRKRIAAPGLFGALAFTDAVSKAASSAIAKCIATAASTRRCLIGRPSLAAVVVAAGAGARRPSREPEAEAVEEAEAHPAGRRCRGIPPQEAAVAAEAAAPTESVAGPGRLHRSGRRRCPAAASP